MKRRLASYVGSLLLLGSGLVQAAPAPDGNTVLILGSSVGPANPSLEASRAAAQGFTVEIATNATWLAKSTADFATYKAIILGDPSCQYAMTTSPALDAALANRATWAPAITGNVVVVGTDPTFHSSFYAGAQGGDQVADSGIAFAAADIGHTGAYIAMSCYYHDTAPMTPVPVLDQFGSFTVQGVGCYNDAHIVAVHPALAGMTDASLSNWSCSVHEAFDSFPMTFIPLAIAENVGGSGSLSFADGTSGVPYILARGRTISPVACGNGILEAPEECDDGNTVSGDGCSNLCRLEEVCGDGIDNNQDGFIDNQDPACQVCGDGDLDPGEDCDDGNTVSGDGCTSDCLTESQGGAPDCTGAWAHPRRIPASNGRFAKVAIEGVIDPDGDPVAITITGVTQDESPIGPHAGRCPDAQGIGTSRVMLRGERLVPGDGRFYHVGFTASDGNGNMCSGVVNVCVPGQNGACVDQGPLYDSSGPCN